MTGREHGDELLVRYVDGELSVQEARQVEQQAAARPETQAKLDALGQLRETVAAHYRAAEEEAAPKLDALWARIERQLDADAPAPAVRAVRAVRSGWLGGVREWLEGYRAHVLTAAMSAAAGALIALWAGGADHQKVVEKVVYVERERPVQVAAAAQAERAEVESLEVSGGTGTIFTLPGDGEGDAPTTVIWVTREDDVTPSGTEGPI